MIEAKVLSHLPILSSSCNLGMLLADHVEFASRVKQMFFKHAFDIADGARLHDTQQNRLWFVFNRKRHHLLCEKVYASLFVREVSVNAASAAFLADIAEGPDLLFGTSLVRRGNDLLVHLLAVHPKGNVLHPIPTKETFDRCGFDLGLCRPLPTRAFDQVKLGASLV